MIEFKHTYLVFRKLREANFLFEEWQHKMKHHTENQGLATETLNKIIEKFYTENIGEVKRNDLNGDKDVVLTQLSIMGFKLIFLESIERYSDPIRTQIILLNYFPVGTSYSPNGHVAIEFKDMYMNKREELDYYTIPNDLANVEGDLYEVEGTGENYEYTRNKYLINTYEPFCRYCEEFNSDKLTFKANKEMWEDFILFSSFIATMRNERSKGIYESIIFDDVTIITDFKLYTKQ